MELKIEKKFEINADELHEPIFLVGWPGIALVAKLAITSIKDSIKEELKSEQDKKIYELSDGQKTTREIGKKVGCSHTKVSSAWNKWASIGLVMPSEIYKGRFKKIVTLGDLGI